MLASWCEEETRRSFMRPEVSLSRTIWQSISKCLVLSWNTGLVTMWGGLWLSQYKIGQLPQKMCKSQSK